MRLTPHTQSVIADTAHQVFGDHVSVKIFGSRLDQRIRGGDIDVLIDSKIHINNARKKSLQLVAKLQIQLGDQPIDVIVIDPHTKQQEIHREALRTGVAL